MDSYRREHDSLGEVQVPNDALWAAQTQRSLQNFPIGHECMPLELIYAIAHIKRAAALANAELGLIDESVAQVVVAAADEILAGLHDGQFPLKIWQTGSGTQTNMNVNEVIATRAHQLAAECDVELAAPIHPNDTINRSQSSNDVFPSAMHVAAVQAIDERVTPAAQKLITELEALATRSEGVLKCGRTHLMDAVPMSFAQEVSGWTALIKEGLAAVEQSKEGLLKLALGGTAVGTGLNAPTGFAELACAKLAQQTKKPFELDPNPFHALSSKDALALSHGAIKVLAANAFKVANDVRWLASGPRTGLGELKLPANEPGSSIMPGKVNPTQAEALAMVCIEVLGNDTAISIAASQGNLELNTYMPLIIANYLRSAELLSDALASFAQRCVAGIELNQERMATNLEHSLMLVTCLTPEIGYERAAQLAYHAHTQGLSLRAANAELGYISDERFVELVRPELMV